ncbi:hypothetical protein Poly30_05700 [Planctomycetes bacterium Poly30]|uniref:Uncharacterized protein n=1 Tax=Saltatorellus ferox TaxID=2528018 RepID=A0A518ELV5_9BACT|nr:hypothetical protein Poly30_05700 [Planctomycetes bacterium Poly30]
MTEHPSENFPTSGSKESGAHAEPSRIFRWIVLVGIAAVLVRAVTRLDPGRLDRAIDAARPYELIDGPPPYSALDLGPLSTHLSDWLGQNAGGGSVSPSAARLSEEGQRELHALGKEVLAACAPPHARMIPFPYDLESDSFRLSDALKVAQLLASAASGDVPAWELDERFDAMLATLHLGSTLTKRHLSGLLVGCVVMEQARRAYEVCQADGLRMSLAQRARLLAALDSIDINAEAMRTHRGAVARLYGGSSPDWWAVSHGWRRVAYRVGGNATTDRAVGLELAVAVQRQLFDQEPEAKRMAALVAEARALDRDWFPFAGANVELHQRIQGAQESALAIENWIAEVLAMDDGR